MSLVEHLQARHLDLNLHQPVLDEVANVATFFLWNLSGQLVGYQQYRPNASKEKSNNPKEGRYYTYRQKTDLAVWGVESLHLTSHVVFVTEGVFDAARLTELGVSAVAVLSNDPAPDVRNWLMSLGRTVVVVADNDAAGRRLAKFGHYAVFTNEKDLGDSSEQFVKTLVKRFV